MTQPDRVAKPRSILEGRKQARERLRALEDAARSIPEDGYVARTQYGTVHIRKLGFGREKDVQWAEVTLAGEVEGGDPQYRVENPPTLVSDPAGDVILPAGRFRRDPLAALAELVGQYGGAQVQRKGIRG